MVNCLGVKPRGTRPAQPVDRDTSQAVYETSQELMDLLRYTAETLSLEFSRWDEQYVKGPNLYFLVVADVNFGAYTDPLGANRWPVERCSIVSMADERFIEAARDVAFTCEGAVIIAADGTIQEQMVRVRSGRPVERTKADELSYPDWMGTKYMSALEASTREEVLWAVTLSEEDWSRHDVPGRHVPGLPA